MTRFHDLGDYVAIPRVTALRLSPDGSWLAAAVQTPGADAKKYVTSIWKIPVPEDAAAGRGGAPARLTRSAEGEGAPQFLPDGSLVFASKRPAASPASPRPGTSRSGAPPPSSSPRPRCWGPAEPTKT